MLSPVTRPINDRRMETTMQGIIRHYDPNSLLTGSEIQQGMSYLNSVRGADGVRRFKPTPDALQLALVYWSEVDWSEPYAS